MIVKKTSFYDDSFFAIKLTEQSLRSLSSPFMNDTNSKPSSCTHLLLSSLQAKLVTKSSVFDLTLQIIG